MSTAEREHIAGLAKGLAIIEAFGAERAELTVSEAAALAGLSRASARRCLLTLERLGYAKSDGRYFRLAPRVLRLGYAYLSASTLARVVQPVLESLAERMHESASLAILDGADVVFIARATSRRSLSAGLSVGTRMPAYCAATGRVLLAAGSDAEAAAVLRASELRKLTPHTLTGQRELMEEIRRVRAQGYAVGDQEIELGLRIIAVPVRDAAGRVLAAMSLAARTSRVARDGMLKKMLPALEAGRRSLASVL
jgi:IclR family pca regulon transcriptional regulator